MGGYAPVIREDHPAPSADTSRTGRPARPGGSDGPLDDDLYVYRDPSARAGYLADQRAQEREAAYWYDLLADPGDTEREEARGPFEPLSPSGGSPPRAGRQQPSAADAMTVTPAGPADYAQPPEPGTAGDEGPEEPAYAQARKLEQIKDLYLTAEAIGEENVDKHFDQLLAQQRELISEYFRQSAAARHGDGLPTQAAASPIEPRQPGGRTGQAGQHGTPEGAGVAAEPPRSW
jgi:hypothetical protein